MTPSAEQRPLALITDHATEDVGEPIEKIVTI
jgi:hypothetical protein